MSHPSVERPASALRLRMLEDMAMRGLREATQRDYGLPPEKWSSLK